MGDRLVFIAAAKRSMDDLTYDQEYDGKEVLLSGRAYYAYTPEIQGAYRLPYNPNAPLAFCHDLNYDPGCAVVAQEAHSWEGDPFP